MAGWRRKCSQRSWATVTTGFRICEQAKPEQWCHFWLSSFTLFFSLPSLPQFTSKGNRTCSKILYHIKAVRLIYSNWPPVSWEWAGVNGGEIKKKKEKRKKREKRIQPHTRWKFVAAQAVVGNASKWAGAESGRRRVDERRRKTGKFT
jgi:hypothetical protein